MMKKSGLAVQDYMLRLAEVSGTSIECINIVKFKRFREKLGPRGSPGPLFIPTQYCLEASILCQQW